MYELFSYYCPSSPKTRENLVDKRTGKIYSNIMFQTYTLAFFNELYSLFYLERKKVVPINLFEIFTEKSLAYWIFDDGSWNKVNKHVVLSTDSFTLGEVEFLINGLNTKYNLKSYKVKSGNGYKIIIPSYSVLILRGLVLPYIHPMMKYKLGL